MRQPYIPQHYKVITKSADEASMHLDVEYSQGWRVTQMLMHPNGGQLIFLMEKPSLPNH